MKQAVCDNCGATSNHCDNCVPYLSGGAVIELRIGNQSEKELEVCEKCCLELLNTFPKLLKAAATQ